MFSVFGSRFDGKLDRAKYADILKESSGPQSGLKLHPPTAQ